MIQYFKPHPWKIIEEGFNPSMNEIAESVFSIGNGMMGQRANLEETYTGKTLQGTYVGGVYYPDKTRVGWWKNGYPEYFAKVINSTYWSGLMIFIDGTEIDLNTGTILDFYRELDMKNGCLSRKCTVKLQNGIEVRIESKRFYSLINKEYSALSYSLTTDSDCNIQLVNYLDADISNKDSNYNEKFWDGLQSESFGDELHILAKTNKLNWIVGTSAKCEIFENGQKIHPKSEHFHSEKQCKTTYQIPTAANKTIRFVKHVITSSNFNHTDDAVLVHGKKSLQKMAASGFDVHLEMNANAWQEKWKTSDVVIQGDVSAQQAVRFNIYQLNQTYCGDDPRLNIGPKGFTGEKYGGSTYWDTEAYCIPFYLVSSDSAISKQLLVYRYKQLDKAIENAQKLGFNNGAALYPMVTMNGEECHNEWEITFEEIHRNGAIAYAIYNYIEHTADTEYLFEGGFEVLLGISRFWAQRVHWSEKQKRFEMHGVTGPNEYENNVNNNWYTSYIAMWCLKYTTEMAQKMHLSNPESFAKIAKKTAFELVDETSQWNHIQQNMYFPYDKEYNVFVQHDGFMEKSLLPVAQLAEEHRPLNQKWSWDRILRSVYIKQADVLQGLYFFEDDFDEDTHRRNFEFYEQFTVHESSLSPCVHSILAAKIGNFDKAYEMYVRTARLDLDNYNNDTEDGLHITSMAGSYLSIVQGFGGLRIKNQELSIRPACPPQWEGYQFNILLLNQPIRVSVEKSKTTIENLGDKSIQIQVNGVHYTVKSGEEVFVNQ
jgi:maltose phosphorylase